MKKKHLYRVHYTVGYRKLTFSKLLPVQPMYDAIIVDSDKKVRYELNIPLRKSNTQIYYNVIKDRYECEVSKDSKQLNVESINDILETYNVCGWKCDTIKQDIEDLKKFIETNH